jgi:hypothetical protein
MYQVKTYIPFLLLIIASIAIGCDSSSEPDTVSGQIFPLKIGNRFVYTNEDYNYDTSVLDSTTIDTITVTSSKPVSSETYYAITFSKLNRITDSLYTINRSDGFWVLDGTGFNHKAKYPANVGDSWGADSLMNGGSKAWCYGKWVVEAKDESVSVPAGIFNCYKYQFDYVDTTNILYSRSIAWYSPNVGLIKEEKYYNGPALHLVWRFQLINYIIK